MAEVAVQLLLERLTSLIVEEGKLLGGVSRDVDDIKDDLDTMRSFLRDADSRGATDEGVKTWVKQVRDMAYDTEDLLDEFLLRLVRPRKQGIFDFLLHKLHYIKHLTTRHRLATEIRNIKTRLKALSERKQAFSFNNNISEGTRSNTTPNAWHDPRIASRYIDEAEVVGTEVPKKKLIGWLTEGELELTIISVVGMGGLGKTTLVNKVYESQMVKKHFDCRVWITVSQSPVSTIELLRTTVKGVLKERKDQAAPEKIDEMPDDELIKLLMDQLREKRYVIILDDIWDIKVWETMKFAFPNFDCGSRIIFTTRIGEVAASSNQAYVYNLEPLSEQEAWRLFCIKAFGSNHESVSTCPDELEKLSRNILKKCRGLPLAIVLIGGLLSSKKVKSVSEWKNIHDSLATEMRDGYRLESLNQILLLSYNNLPHYLKPCFLYLSIFPEDHFIKRMKLIRLWIAEGFIEEKQGVTMEVVAGDYVNELISRSMIQIAKLNKSNEVKSFRIHDLMRETIQLKSEEECFSTTITIIGSQTGMRVGLHEEKARRMSIYPNNIIGDQNYNYAMDSRCSHVRSLMMFQLNKISHSFQRKFFDAFRLLRVLDLKGACIVEFPPELAKLIHLRYLSLRSTKITVLPKSVGKLKNLETLDLKRTLVSELPVEILKLQRLRHLLVYRYSDYDLNSLSCDTYGVSAPTGIGSLTSLQKLAFLDVQQQHQGSGSGGGAVIVKELGKLTQLRRLCLTNLRSKDGRDLCLALDKMEHLYSLGIERSSIKTTTDVNKEEEEFLELDSLIRPPQLLHRLYLEGRLKRLPVWIASLKNLTYLWLLNSRLSCEEGGGDLLKAFQHMPNLMILYLSAAYDGEELCCSEVGGYKNLKRLLLHKMEGLKRVRFMKGSMPMLRELTICNCLTLEMVPHGIEHLSDLQELNLWIVNHGLVERIRKKGPRSPQGEAKGDDGEDCWKVQHIPTILHYYVDHTLDLGKFQREYLQFTQ